MTLIKENWTELSAALSAGVALSVLADQHADWSRATFGSDSERGPIGPLKHLEKEAREAQVEAEKLTAPADLSTGVFENGMLLSSHQVARRALRVELADCLLLLLDASRRAGLTTLQLIQAAQEKLEVNRTRQWGKSNGDEPVEHVRTEETSQ